MENPNPNTFIPVEKKLNPKYGKQRMSSVPTALNAKSVLESALETIKTQELAGEWSPRCYPVKNYIKRIKYNLL